MHHSLENRGRLAKDFVLVSISNSPWSYPYWTSRQFLMYEISKHVPVIYAIDRTYIRDLWELSYWKKTFFQKDPPPFESPRGLSLCASSSAFPRIYFHPGIDRFLAREFGRLLKRRSSRLGIKKVVAYIWEPHLIDCVEGLKPYRVIYHPYDKFDVMAKNMEARESVLDAERRILRVAHAVITPASKIAATIKHSNVHVVKNAVFMPAFLSNQPKTSSTTLDPVPRPRIGYIGVINSKVDFAPLLNVAQSRPEWSLVFLGPTLPGPWQNDVAFQKIKRLPNVSFFDPVTFDKVHSVMGRLDVGITPYKLSTWAGFCESPLKMYQYWAAGIPVVSSPLPQLADQPGIVSVATNVDEWIRAIEREIADNSDPIKKQRRKLASENTWDHRAQEVLKIIRKTFLI